MPRTSFLPLARLALALACLLIAPTAASASTPNSAFADEVYSRINTERRNKGVGNLVRVRAAELAAQLHAMDMANREYMAHYTQQSSSPIVPDPQGYPGIQFTSGMSPADRLRKAGFSEAGRGWGENVGYNWGYESGSPADIVRRWMESPSHKENVLQNDFKGTGIGCAVSASGKVYYAQAFIAVAAGATISRNAALWSSETPPPATDTTAPAGWTGFSATGTGSVRVTVRDAASGLAPSTAAVRYSTDGGQSWSAWQAATCSGTPGATTAQQIAASVPVGQGGLNRVQFQIRDVAGNTGASPSYTPSAPKAKKGKKTRKGRR